MKFGIRNTIQNPEHYKERLGVFIENLRYSSVYEGGTEISRPLQR